MGRGRHGAGWNGSAKGYIRLINLPHSRSTFSWILSRSPSRKKENRPWGSEVPAHRDPLRFQSELVPLPVLHFVEGKDLGLNGQAGNPDGQLRREPPAYRAGGKGIDELEAPGLLSLPDLSAKSSGYAMETVAAYGTRWAAMISTISFLGWLLRFRGGVVVVQAPQGVAEERWIPVFMYASLS